jgi:hypothetical protein
MKREAVLTALKKIEPALARKPLFPVLTHLLFKGGRVVAYDDSLMMRRELDFDFEGCVPGRLLIDFLSASVAEDLELVKGEETTLGLKLGRSKAELATMPADAFPSKVEPDDKDAVELLLTESFVPALAKAAVSMGEDSLQPWCFGITLDLANQRLLSTNRSSAAFVTLAEPKKPLTELMPPRFVEVFLKLANKTNPKRLMLWKGDWVGADFEDGTRLQCKTVPEAKAATFDDILKRTSGDAKGELLAIPTGLSESLIRSQVFMTSPVLTERLADLRITKDRLNVEVRSERGSFRDSLKLSGHPELHVRVVSEILGRVLPFSQKMSISEKCVMLEGEGCSFLVATSVAPKPVAVA